MTRMSLAERRQKLLEAALAVIGRSGVAAATTRAIAAEAGMPLASFHYAFESHQHLMVEAMASLGEAELAYCEQVQYSGTGVHEVVANALAAYLDDLEDRAEQHLSRMELSDYALRTEGQESVPARWRAARLEQLTRKLTDFDQTTGALQGADPAAVATVVQGLGDAVLAAYLLTRDRAAAQAVIDAWSVVQQGT
ncbi:TetR/AcrR family transcriptional regulator [Luteococcus sp. OSA5]|uniref:TetR/AcrR family transcriptional regulator n=1 Tax=Luteococcus sp. OSA5 TaxID=3401630 RepID=UPI003B437E86